MIRVHAHATQYARTLRTHHPTYLFFPLIFRDYSSKKITMVIHLISLLQMPIAKEMKKSNLHQVFQGHKAMVTICLALGNYHLSLLTAQFLVYLIVLLPTDIAL